MKYFFIMLMYFSCCQVIFYSIKTTLLSIRNIFTIYIFFIQEHFFLLLYEFLIHNFSSEHIWSSICIYKSQNFTLSMQIEQQHEDAEKLQRRILECCVVKAK